MTFRSAQTITRSLRSLLTHLDPHDEVVIIDCASDDDTLGAIEGVITAYPDLEERVFVHPQQRNLGPAIGRNRGATYASGSILAFVDPDVEVAAGWLDSMLDHLEDPNTGAVGPLIDSGRGPQAASNHLPPEIVARSGGWEEDDTQTSGCEEVAVLAAERFTGDYIRVGFLTGSCLVMMASVFDEAGGLDEELILGAEDYALAWHLALSGLELRVILDSYVSHAEHTSLDSVDPRLAVYLIQFGANRLAEKVVAHYLAAGERPPSPAEIWGTDDLTPSPQGFEIFILDPDGGPDSPGDKARGAALRVRDIAPVSVDPIIIRADDGLVDLLLLEEEMKARGTGVDFITVLLGPDLNLTQGWTSRVAAACSAFSDYDMFVEGAHRTPDLTSVSLLEDIEPGSPLTLSAEMTLEAAPTSFYAFQPGAIARVVADPSSTVARITGISTDPRKRPPPYSNT